MPATRPATETALSAAVFATSLIAAVRPAEAQDAQTPANPETAESERWHGSTADRADGSARWEARFAELDPDADGRLTAEEYTASSRDRMARTFTPLDLDESGDLSMSELASRAEGMARMFVRVEGMPMAASTPVPLCRDRTPAAGGGWRNGVRGRGRPPTRHCR